jgi:polyribonucleotide nucleotidyltransferase
MVEGEMKELSEDEFLEALKFGHDAVKNNVLNKWHS